MVTITEAVKWPWPMTKYAKTIPAITHAKATQRFIGLLLWRAEDRPDNDLDGK